MEGKHLAAAAALIWASSTLAADDSNILWQIGQADNSAAEFSLSQNQYSEFLLQFGSPDKAFYVGITQSSNSWPCLLPGPLDDWAGSGSGGRWDQMNTLPIGFTLDTAPGAGRCSLLLDFCDIQATNPPRLRVTINGTGFELDLPKGGSDASLRGDYTQAKEHVASVEFPVSLLRPGYNEISLRALRGSWCLFDSLRMEAPVGVKLAPLSTTVVRSVSPASYTISKDPKTSATVLLEVYQHERAGKVSVQVGRGTVRDYPLEPGVQVLELPVPAGPVPSLIPVRVTTSENSIQNFQLSLRSAPKATPADYVDVFRGTAHSRWMIAPGPWMPFSMVKISPDNQTQGWCAGYDYTIEAIDCFSHIHEWTMAGLGMMPSVGPLRTRPGLDGSGFSSRIDKRTERGGIGFYEVMLKDTGIKVELAATTRASLQRYTFPAADKARVLLDFLLPNEYGMQVLKARVRRSASDEIEGTIETHFPDLYYNGEQRFDLHFVMQLSRPVDALGGWEGDSIRTNVESVEVTGDCGAFLEFKTQSGEKVLIRTGISLVSLTNARLNLEQELAKPFGWQFTAVVENQRRTWNELLSRVEIESPDAREKNRFYSNFYRALVGRNIWSDVNGEWLDPEERVQQLKNSRAVMLGCDAFWNTFWNLNQVMNLITPDWSTKWVNSELALYDACGWLSKGPAGLEYISVMVAEHEIPLLVAAAQHGIKGIDAGKILEAAVKMQTTLPQKHPGGGWVGNENLESYLKYGYVAADSPVVQGAKAEWTKAWGSNTYEYSYDDWCVAQLALKLGRADIAEQFMKRSRSWRNQFDTETGFARPRKANGEWLSPFDPFHTPGFVEGNAWQYTWFVPQDASGLVELMGRERFINRLNEAFERSAPTRFNAAGERFEKFPINHGNQPTMHAAWLFNWAGQPWMSQKWTRAILDAFYGHNPADAYLGDEDQGQMSAWFVMSSLGLFQTDGGCRVNPVYEIGSPLYPKAVIHLSKEHYSGKTFTIETRNAYRQNRYVQSATLNGRPLDSWHIPQKEVVKGGTLVIELGLDPNLDWAKNCPPPQ